MKILLIILVCLSCIGCDRLRGPKGDTGQQGSTGNTGETGKQGEKGNDGDDSEAGDMYTYKGYVPYDCWVYTPVIVNKCLINVSIDSNHDGYYEPTTNYSIDYYNGRIRINTYPGTTYWINVLIT